MNFGLSGSDVLVVLTYLNVLLRNSVYGSEDARKPLTSALSLSNDYPAFMYLSAFFC